MSALPTFDDATLRSFAMRNLREASCSMQALEDVWGNIPEEWKTAQASRLASAGFHWRARAPRRGAVVYFMGRDHRGPVKIGTAKNPERRLREVQTGFPYPLRLLGQIPGDRWTEAALHRRFAGCRLSGEWFTVSPELARMLDRVGPETPRALVLAGCMAAVIAGMEGVLRAIEAAREELEAALAERMRAQEEEIRALREELRERQALPAPQPQEPAGPDPAVAGLAEELRAVRSELAAVRAVLEVPAPVEAEPQPAAARPWWLFWRK